MSEISKMNIKEVLQTQGQFVGTTSGVSKRPMIISGRDVVVIEKKTARLKPLDVALYMRNDRDYVLHRVLEVTESGYIIRGDNCYADEIVEESTVLGVLREFYQKDKHILCSDEEYLKYVKKRLQTYPARRKRVMRKRKIRAFLSKIKRALKKPFSGKKGKK